MRFETYNATPGLDRIPAAERFAVWRATHKQLLRDDASYRRRYTQYLVAVVIVAVMPCSLWAGSGAVGMVAFGLLSLISIASIIFLANQQQRRMNQRIGSALKSQPH